MLRYVVFVVDMMRVLLCLMKCVVFFVCVFFGVVLF